MTDQALWYTTRAAGAVTLVLFTAVVVLGQVARLRVESRSWPRFMSADLHRNLSLLGLVFLALHIVTAVVDPFTSLGIAPVVAPFLSGYRRVWLGLGTTGFLLILALVITSLLRGRVGARAWKVIHWAAYAAWPLAVAHGLGTGTDAFSAWLFGITIACVATVAVVTAWRVAAAPPDPLGTARRAAAARHRANAA